MIERLRDAPYDQDVIDELKRIYQLNVDGYMARVHGKKSSLTEKEADRRLKLQRRAIELLGGSIR